MLRPLGDRVLVKVDKSPELSSGGIVLPDSAQEKPQRGVVISVGEGRRLDDGSLSPMEVKAGDRVIFSKYGGTEVRDGEQEYIVLRQDDIYAIEVDSGKKAPAAKKRATKSKSKKK